MINTDLKKARTKLFSGCTLNVWVKLDTIWPQRKENHSWIMALVVEKTFLPFFQTFFFLGLENCWEISRLFQEFKTLYKSCHLYYTKSRAQGVVQYWPCPWSWSWTFIPSPVKIIRSVLNETAHILLKIANYQEDILIVKINRSNQSICWLSYFNCLYQD